MNAQVMDHKTNHNADRNADPAAGHTTGHKPDGKPVATRDPRRWKNIRTGLLLALVAFGFFLLVIFKHQALGA